MLKVKNLSRTGVDATSFEVKSGECVAIVGPSGAGKTLLLRAIADLDMSVGEVEANGLTRSRTAAPTWRANVMYVPAESGWWMDTVGDHFDPVDRAMPILASLLLPADCVNWPVAQLSTGEKQRLALARAVNLRPIALLLDEPTASLDHKSAETVEELILQQLAEGVSIVLVTHDAEQAKRLASQILRMDQGHIVDDSP